MAKKKTSTALPLAPADEGYTFDELRELVELPLRAGISVLLRGHPGVGKSSLGAELSARMGLELVDIRLAQRDPAELAGVYFPDRRRKVLSLFPPDWVRQACDRPVLVFLDEINAAVTQLHQAAAYQIVLEHRVGPFAFHPDTVVLGAGNIEEDNAIVSQLSSALSNRFAHYILRVDAEAWLRWGTGAGIHEAILAHVGLRGEEVLYNNSGEPAFPTPRSWEMASRVLCAADERVGKRAVAACVGRAAAERLFADLRIYHRINAARVIRKGAAMDFSRGKKAEPSFVYAAVFAVAAWLCSGEDLSDRQLPNVVKFLRSPGLDPEYMFLFLRQLRRAPELLVRLRAVPAYRKLAGELVSVQAGLYR